MKPGKSRFKKQITKIEILIQKANTQENPALWLYLHDLRTPMFMLEGLAKLYSSINDTKIFSRLKDQFKLIEDAIGSLDYYASFQKEFSSNPNIDSLLLFYFHQKTTEKIAELKQLLETNNWLNGNQIKALNKNLDYVNWDEEAKEKLLLAKFYEKQIKKIIEFVDETGFPFKHIEENVHELRRKIRWLSIYPQALNGAVKFKEIKPMPKYLDKYLTPEIVNSPFNVLPFSAKQTELLEFDKNKFLALSWLINELGVLKDKGLSINALKDAIQSKMLLKDETAYAEAYKIIGDENINLDQILEKASEISKIYFDEKNINFLL